MKEAQILALRDIIVPSETLHLSTKNTANKNIPAAL